MMYEGDGYIRTSELERQARMLRAEAIADLIVKAVRWVKQKPKAGAPLTPARVTG